MPDALSPPRLTTGVMCTKMKNGTDINLQLRTEILEIALNLEYEINQLLLRLLSVENQNRKAISNKSSSLSFKNKIDLLFDLDVLTADEHLKLLLVMEFRNQFLHNIECCFFEDAANQLGADKAKRLLKFCNEETSADKELQYQDAFKSLFIECLEILSKKLKDRINQIKERARSYTMLIESQIYFIDKYFDMVVAVMTVCEQHAAQGNPAVLKLTEEIMNTTKDDIDSLVASEEYIQIREEFEKSTTPEKIKSYFKDRRTQPGAAPNGGPATPGGSPGVTEGPPSVS